MGRRIVQCTTDILNNHTCIAFQCTTEILNNHTCIPLKCKTNPNILLKAEKEEERVAAEGEKTHVMQ